MTNTINSDLYLSSVQNKPRETNNNTLGQDAFLKILITQLQNQDPANPMEDTEFISQMATFSELEQMMQVNKNLEKLVESQKNQQLLAYNQLLGKNVEWQQILVDETNPDAEPEVVSGNNRIQSINFSEDGPVFTLDNGEEITYENIKGISIGTSENTESIENSLVPPNNTNSIESASHLIGKMVSWKVEDEIKSAIVESVSMKDGQMYYNLNDENNTKLTDDQIVSVEMV